MQKLTVVGIVIADSDTVDVIKAVEYVFICAVIVDYIPDISR